MIIRIGKIKLVDTKKENMICNNLFLMVFILIIVWFVFGSLLIMHTETQAVYLERARK